MYTASNKDSVEMYKYLMCDALLKLLHFHPFRLLTMGKADFSLRELSAYFWRTKEFIFVMNWEAVAGPLN